MPAARSPRSRSLRDPSLLGSYLACGVSALRASIACAGPAPALTLARRCAPRLSLSRTREEGFQSEHLCHPERSEGSLDDARSATTSTIGADPFVIPSAARDLQFAGSATCRSLAALGMTR